MNDFFVSATACVLAGCALGYCEVRGWHGVTRLVTYAGVSLMVAELGAGPLLWQLYRLSVDWIETLAMGISLTAVLMVLISEGRRWAQL